jgi:hypothetical protein
MGHSHRDTLLDEAESTLLGGVPPENVLVRLLNSAEFAAGWNTAMKYVYSGVVPCGRCVAELRRRGAAAS